MTLKDLSPFKRKNVPMRRETDTPFGLLRHEMDTMFDDFVRGFDIEPLWTRKLGAFSPQVDVTESEKEIKIAAELPGIDEKDIDLSVTKDTLTIKGEKKEEKEDDGKDYYRMERSYGSFYRTIPLPTEVETDKISASYKKGILKIRIPKSAKAIEDKKKIAIKAE
jgi:HSP20 family protein